LAFAFRERLFHVVSPVLLAATPPSDIELGVERTGQSIPRICRDAPRLRSELLFGGFAGVSLGAGLCHGRASPESPSASASHRHDVPSATSDVPSATSNPNDGDGYACGDAGGSLPLALSASPPLL
jgi:hypothetical protein